MSKKHTIQWTEQSLESLEFILSQIIEKWNYQTAKDFDNEVKSLITRLENNSKLYPPSKKRKIRKCVIHKNTSLVYRIKKSDIELITFIDNRSNHHY